MQLYWIEVHRIEGRVEEREIEIVTDLRTLDRRGIRNSMGNFMLRGVWYPNSVDQSHARCA